MEHDIDELYECIRNLREENYNLKEENISLKEKVKELHLKIKDMMEDMEHNFKRISVSEQYDVFDSDFI